MVKNLPTKWETWLRSLGWEDPLEEEMATHSSILAWRIPWTEEPGGLQSMGSNRIGPNWATNTFFLLIVTLSIFSCVYWPSDIVLITQYLCKLLLGKMVLSMINWQDLAKISLFIFKWSIVDLQCCDSFWCTTKWFSYTHTHTYIYIHFSTFFSIMVYHRTLNIVPCYTCYTLGPCCLSILYI